MNVDLLLIIITSLNQRKLLTCKYGIVSFYKRSLKGLSLEVNEVNEVTNLNNYSKST